MPLPLTVSCFSKIHIGVTFLVQAYLGSPGKRAVKRVCVCDYYAMLLVSFTTSEFKIFALANRRSVSIVWFYNFLTTFCSSSRLVLPFWYRLTQVVPDIGPLNVCVCVCVFCSSSKNMLQKRYVTFWFIKHVSAACKRLCLHIFQDFQFHMFCFHRALSFDVKRVWHFVVQQNCTVDCKWSQLVMCVA